MVGLLAGLWAALRMSGWLEAHWQGAQPALVYSALRWIVAALAGLAVASLLQWWGDQLGRAVQAGPVGWVDRGGGVAIGAVMGLVTMAFAVMVALLIPRPRGLAEEVARSRAAVPLMARAAEACSLSVRYLPAGPWLEEHFRQAHRRAREARHGERHSRS